MPMNSPSNWWITFSVRRYMQDGVATLLSGPCVAHPDKCQVTAQRLAGDWMEPQPWFKENLHHPSLPLALEQGLAIYEQATQIEVAAMPPMVAGIDGETFSIEFGAGFNRATFTWFMEPPEQWKGFASLASAMEQLGEQCLASGA